MKTYHDFIVVELGQDTQSSGPTTLYIDNLSAKMFADEYMIRNRSHHIDTKYHFIRGKITQCLVSLVHQSTKDMTADILTKPLGKKLFERFRHLMGVRQLLVPCRPTTSRMASNICITSPKVEWTKVHGGRSCLLRRNTSLE